MSRTKELHLVMTNTQDQKSGMTHGIFWITKRISLGRFVTPERARALRDQRITHVLNVGTADSIITPEDYGFEAVRDCPIPDLSIIPDDLAIIALDAMHTVLSIPQSRLFVHCMAGQNRSPTVIWLYLIACGLSENEARKLITDHTLDAVPGHSRLVNQRLVSLVKSHGAESYLPLSDSSILVPAY